MGEAKRRKEQSGDNYGTEKIWDKIIAPKAFGFDGDNAFSEQDCISSAMTTLQYNLAEKINFGIVLLWDKNEEMWTNFYAWHCWAVTKQGQPFDCSVHYWHSLFPQLNPPIIPEKNPQEMTCQLINNWGNKDVFKREEFSADAIYCNGGLTNHNINLVPEEIKKAIYFSGKFNGLTFSQVANLIGI